MNYYEHHLGDWAAATGHLTWDEDMAYTRLLRAYYHSERAIPQGQQYRLSKASTPAQRKAVDQVLSEFFVLEDDGAWHQKRADAEIARYLAGEPEREAKKANEDARMKRHREERARLFQVLADNGQHAAWNIGMNELRELVKRCSKPLPATAPATPATATHTQTPDTIPKEEEKTDPAGLVADESADLLGKVVRLNPPDDCPHEEIIAAYHEILPELPAIRVWNDLRRKHLRARWREDKARQALDWWRNYFAYVRDCPFLMGNPGPWQASLPWLVESSNLPKVIEGNYERKQG